MPYFVYAVLSWFPHLWVSLHEMDFFPNFKLNSIMGTFNIYAMFVITVGEYFIVRFPHHQCAHCTSVPCLWSQKVSTRLLEFHIHPQYSCFCAIFVITASECLIVRIPHASTVLILLLCHVCDQSEWVLDCQNSTCIHGAHPASVSCLWSQDVSAWLSHASTVLILLLCHVCDHS